MSIPSETERLRFRAFRGSDIPWLEEVFRDPYARRFFPFTWPALACAWSAYGLQQALRLWLKGRRGTAVAIAMGVGDGVRGRFGNRNESVLRLCAAHPNDGGAGS